MTIAIPTEYIAIVLYWRLRKAQAPWNIISPISFILGVPVGRFKTFLANIMAKIIVITPDMGTIQNIPGISPLFQLKQDSLSLVLYSPGNIALDYHPVNLEYF